MVHAALLLLMLEAVTTNLVSTISLKRSTQNLQLSTSWPADYPIYSRSPMACSCSAHEYGSALARPVTVRSAGAEPSTIAAMMRGDTKARGCQQADVPFSLTLALGDLREGCNPPELNVIDPSPSFGLSLIHISEPTRLGMISYAVFCL